MRETAIMSNMKKSSNHCGNERHLKKIENLFLELTLRDNVTPWWLIVHCVSGQSNLLCAAPAR